MIGEVLIGWIFCQRKWDRKREKGEGKREKGERN